MDAMKAAGRGLIDQALTAVGAAIETIINLKNMLTNMLAKAAAVVDKIIKDPIGFLGNLISGVKQGFQNFSANIMQHLQAGLLGWLTGAMGPMGITIPENLFSLEGIFDLVMQVLGVNWEFIRGKAVKLLG